jgi:hypothetical protein
MKIVGVLIILVSFPAFMMLLGMGERYRYWAFVALGALPIVSSGLNIDVAFYDLAMWPGHTKGIIVSLTDTLAMAIAVHYSKLKPSRALTVVWLIYLVLHIPGVFVAGYSTASLSYLWSLLRGFVYFFACSVVFMRGGFKPLVLGLSVSIMINGIDTIINAASGQIQASGILGHRNYSGLVTNLAVPTLFASLLSWRKVKVLALGLAFAAVTAALGGSRASVALFGASVALTLFIALIVKPGKKTTVLTVMTILGALIMTPVVFHKMNQRFNETGGGFSFEEDGERLAFRRASKLMNIDYPFGVGLNQYAVKSNAEGYAAEAGVVWTTIANTAIVHNSYVLVRTEGGHVALIGVFVMLGSLLSISAAIAMKKAPTRSERLYAAAVFISVSILAIHINYEWAFVRIHVIYALAFLSAILSSILDQKVKRRSFTAANTNMH